jgi:beta-lactamase regulating signal transducer with metallopeptidase domain
MNTLLTFFTPSWLADVSLQITLWLAFAGVVSLWPGLPAARRHFVQAGALLTLPLLVVAGFIVPGWRLMPLPSAESVSPGKAPSVVEVPNVDPFAMSLAVKTTVLDAERPPVSWGVVWLLGVAAGLGLLACSAKSLCRLRRESAVVEDERLTATFREETAALGLRLEAACLRQSDACGVPMTWGLFDQKTLLLPREAVDWPEARLRLVLRHELAHLARGDVPVSTVMTLVAVLLWFHPAVWLMLRAAQRSREQACDDLAMGRGHQNAADFARELLAAVEGLVPVSKRPLLPLALAMSVSSGARLMRGRLQNILRGPEERGGFGLWQKAGLVLPACALGGLLAGLTACRKDNEPKPSEAMIWVQAKVLSVPVDSPVLAEAGLVMDGKNKGLQSLGVIPEAALQTLLQGLSQQKGVDLMSAPSITTRSGQKAVIEVAREFIYPTEFDPPRHIAKDNTVIPTTPTAFEMRPVGIRIEMIPELLSKDEIQLTVMPEITEFEGFINYGDPVTQKDGKVVTPNAVKQPMFRSLKMSSSFVLTRREAVMIGGLGSPEGVLIPHETEPDTLVTAKSNKAGSLIFFVFQASEVLPPKPPTPPASDEPSVTIFGQVLRQGKYTLKAGMTLGDLLSESKGLSERANTKEATLKRQGQTQPLELEKVDFPLQNGDTVIVDEKKG